MGASQSFPAASDSRAVKNSPGPDLNEKFQAVRLDDDEERVLSETGRVSRAKTEDYVRQLLKDPKNRLGLSALSTNNPSQVCIE
jgi:bleomycin hydrolase